MAKVESRHRATSEPEARAGVLERDQDAGRRVRPVLVHRPRGAPEELRDHARRDRGCARRRDGLRRLVDHRLQRDRGVGHGRDPRPGDVPADAARAARRDGGRPDDLRHRHARREPYEGDPRYVLRRALERMRSMGFDTFNVGPELEYFLFRDDTRHGDARRGRLLRDDDAGRRDRAAQRDDPGARGDRASRSSTTTTRSAPSQHEIDMRFARALEMADHTITYRLIVKEVAEKAGYYATFMPKPLFGENGSGMHTHMSLFTDGRNAVLRRRRRVPPVGDRQGVHRRAAAARARDLGRLRAVGELVQAARARATRRPSTSAWSQRNRSALIRIPLYKPGSEQATRAEIRCPDPACNPYLTFAALLHAGLEGIEQGYELDEPMETNLYHLSPEERRERGIVVAAGDARRGDRRARRLRADAEGARRRTSSSATWS